MAAPADAGEEHNGVAGGDGRHTFQGGRRLPSAVAPSTDYFHSSYHFSLDRSNMRRMGDGELWFAFDQHGMPYFRLRGLAQSPRFGDGEISIVADASQRRMYAMFKLGELHEAQCLVYPFPNFAENVDRMQKLRDRMMQVRKWAEGGSPGTDLNVKWSDKYTVVFSFGDNGLVRGVDLREGQRVIKTVRLAPPPAPMGRWNASKPHTLCSDLDGSRKYRDYQTLDACKALCEQQPKCGAIYGARTMETSKGPCWTVQGKCEEAPSPTEFQVWHLTDDAALPAAGSGPDMSAFAPPSQNCLQKDVVHDPLAIVELRAPHQASSALNDLLLAMTAATEQHADNSDAERVFLLLLACTVPGDVAVLIEDPVPPRLESLHNVAFDYRTEIMKLGGNLSFSDPAADIFEHIEHTSTGLIWFGLDWHAFKLQDYQEETKVGPVVIGILAKSRPETEPLENGERSAMLIAHVNLSAQAQAQCVEYEYPVMSEKNKETFMTVAMEGLQFYSVSQLRGEDCGIFVAPLARQRWVHIWVDMESDNPDAILRVEVRKNGQLLRRTEVMNWRAEAPPNASRLQPPAVWGCQPGTKPDFAHLGLKEVDSWSAELLDTLYAVRGMTKTFAALEILALAGDVNLMVEEPALPPLYSLPAISFDYAAYIWSAGVSPAKGETLAPRTSVDGRFVHDQRTGWMLLQASTSSHEGGSIPASGRANVTLLLGPSTVAIRIQEVGGNTQCLTVRTESLLSKVADGQEIERTMQGSFDGVESIGELKCNRFTFPQGGAHNASVKFWYSEDEGSVCQFQTMPPTAPDGTDSAGTGALIYIPVWRHIDSRRAYDDLVKEAEFPTVAGQAAPDSWNCQDAAKLQDPWLHFEERGAEPFKLFQPNRDCAASSLLAKWSGLAAQSVHGCYESCVNRPGCEYFSFLIGADCRLYTGECNPPDVDMNGMEIFRRRSRGFLPASHALVKLAEVAASVGLMTKPVAELMSRMVVVPPSYGSGEGAASVPSQEAAASVLAPEVRHFSFRYSAARIIKPDHPDAAGNLPPASPAPPGSPLPIGNGHVYVDLDARRLYLRSEVTHYSAGIEHAESGIIYSGDQGNLFVRTKVGVHYQECWSLKTPGGELPGDGPKVRNPFVGAKPADQTNWYEVPVPGDQQLQQRIRFRVAVASGALEALRLEDLGQKQAVDVNVSHWATSMPEGELFDPASEELNWGCHTWTEVPDTVQLPHWHLLDVFFPSAVDRAQQPSLGLGPQLAAQTTGDAQRRLSV